MLPTYSSKMPEDSLTILSEAYLVSFPPRCMLPTYSSKMPEDSLTMLSEAYLVSLPALYVANLQLQNAWR